MMAIVVSGSDLAFIGGNFCHAELQVKNFVNAFQC